MAGGTLIAGANPPPAGGDALKACLFPGGGAKPPRTGGRANVRGVTTGAFVARFELKADAVFAFRFDLATAIPALQLLSSPAFRPAPRLP